MKFRNIRTPLILVLCLTAAIPLAIIWGVVFFQYRQMGQTADTESMKLATANLDSILSGVYSMANSQQELLERTVAASMNVARDRLTGEVGFEKARVSWDAKNQVSGAILHIELPLMKIGSWTLEPVDDPKQTVPFVDEVTALTGSTAIVFQRMNDAGDMLRVAASAKADDGKRLIGTYMPSIDTAASTVLKGKGFAGRALVGSTWYVSAYQPILDGGGKVVGMLFVGMRQESSASVKQQILNIKVGTTGYVYVLDSAGHYTISQGGKRDGELIWESKDASGRLFIQDIIKKALVL
jgi:methyl-accepting chemotaxis protein